MPKARKPMPHDNAGLLFMMDKALIDTAIPAAPGVSTKRVHPKKGPPPTPGGMEALEQNRAGTQWGGHRRRMCQKRGCKQPALTDAEHCRWHLTPDERHRYSTRPKGKGRWVKSRPAAARRIVQEMIARNRLPVDLLMEPTFKKVWASRRHPHYGRGTIYSDNMTWTQHVNMLAFEMVRAWLHLREHGDYTPWAKAVQRARDMGIL